MSSLNDVFHALSDPTRREVLRMLRKRDMTAGEIAEAFPLALSTLSAHFKTLKYAGLVVTERQGTRIVYSLNASVLEETLAAVFDFMGTGKPSRGEQP